MQNINHNYSLLFNSHLLKPIHKGAIFNNSVEIYWPALILFLILSFVVVLKITASSKTLRVLNAAYSLQVARQLEREDYSQFKRVPVLLSSIFVLTIAFLFFKLNELFGFVLEGNDSLFQYIFFVLLIIVMYTVKFITGNIISYITNTNNIINEYFNSTLIINHSVGLILLPLMILAQLSHLYALWLVVPGVLLLLLAYLLRLFRGFVFAGIDHGIGILQLFVYLCALEILPLLVLIKFLIVNF